MDSREVCKALGLPVIPTVDWFYIGTFGEIRRTRTMFEGLSCYVVIQVWYGSSDDFWLVCDNLDLPCSVMYRDFFNLIPNVHHKTRSYRIYNVKSTGEIVQKFDTNAAYQKMLMAVFS